MKLKVLADSALAVAAMAFGVLLGSVAGTGGVEAQTPSASATPQTQTPGNKTQPAATPTTKINKNQAEKAALAAAPGSTVAHTRLQKDANGTLFWDVDFTNGGGVVVNADTGAVITAEAAGTDHPNGGRPGGHGGRGQQGTPPATQP